MTDQLAFKTRRGLSWNLAGAVMTNGTRLVVLVVLGRLLTSTDFGIVAAAVSVNTIVHSFRDIGLGAALIQRKQLEPGHLTTSFAVSMYLGIALSLILFLGAPWIGAAFHIPGSIDIIRALAVLFVLRNLSAISQIMCRREMRFRLIALIDTSSFVLGSAASIAGAVLGAGAWALVAGYLVEELLATALYLLCAPTKMSLRIDRARLRELLDFGAAQTVTQIANTIAMYGDNVVVGEALGARMLGFYSRAYDLIKFPTIVFDAIVGNVLFPAFSRIQDDRENLANGLRRGTFANALVLAPASAALLVLAPEAIRILIGPGWDDAVLPFQIFAVTMVVRTNQRLAALVALAAGAARPVTFAVLVYMVCVVGGAALSTGWGISAVATSTSIAIAIVGVETWFIALRVSDLPARDLFGAYVPGLVLSALVVVVGWPLAHALRAAHVATPVVFATITAVAIATCAATVFVWVRRGHGDFAWLGDELRRLRRGRRQTPR